MSRVPPRAIAALAVFLLVASAPSPGNASSETLARSVSNILFSPFDLILSPYMATTTVYDNWKNSDDSVAVKVAYPLPGVIWVSGVQAGASVIRGVTGLMELIPAIPLLFFETDLDPLFDPVERNEAVVDTTIFAEKFTIKFGIDYTSIPSY